MKRTDLIDKALEDALYYAAPIAEREKMDRKIQNDAEEHEFSESFEKKNAES